MELSAINRLLLCSSEQFILRREVIGEIASHSEINLILILMIVIRYCKLQIALGNTSYNSLLNLFENKLIYLRENCPNICK